MKNLEHEICQLHQTLHDQVRDLTLQTRSCRASAEEFASRAAVFEQIALNCPSLDRDTWRDLQHRADLIRSMIAKRYPDLDW
jgi:hypothetical protein